jgi:hypothetical protein
MGLVGIRKVLFEEDTEVGVDWAGGWRVAEEELRVWGIRLAESDAME